MKGFTRDRETGRRLRAIGVAAVAASLAVALFLTLREDSAADLGSAPAAGHPVRSSRGKAALRRAREALGRGDPVAAAVECASTAGADPELREEIAGQLADRARRAADGWDLDGADRLLDLARRLDPDHPDALRLAEEVYDRRGRLAEIERGVEEARKAAKEGDLEAAIAAARRATGVDGPTELSTAATELLGELESEQAHRVAREEAMTEATELLDEGKVADARRVLESYGRASGDRDAGARADALRELETKGGADAILPTRKALLWLVAHRDPKDGAFHSVTFASACKDPHCRGTGREDWDEGVNGLALMALTAWRPFDLRGEFREPADRVAAWLLSRVGDDGVVRGTHYNAAITALALLERARALGPKPATGEDPAAKERAAAGRILEYLATKGRLADGGWRYGPNQQESDTSVTCWVMQAFHAAAAAGVPVPERAAEDGLHWLDGMIHANGRVDYIAGRGGGPNMETCALLVELLFGADPRRTPLRGILERQGKQIAELEAHPERLADRDFYGLYYTTYALEALGGEPFEKWGPIVAKELASRQETKGHGAGSFEEKRGMGRSAGRLYSTAMGALTLMAWYRHRPVDPSERR